VLLIFSVVHLQIHQMSFHLRSRDRNVVKEMKFCFAMMKNYLTVAVDQMLSKA